MSVYKEELDEIFFQSCVCYAENIYSSLTSPEADYGLTLDEILSIYFYTLEWNPPQLNLYSRLNNLLSSNERNQHPLHHHPKRIEFE